MAPTISKINLAEKFSLFNEHWQPRITGKLNDNYVKIAKLQGEFEWHYHEAEDELFLVIKGSLLIKLRGKDIQLNEGELVIIPKGVEHLPVAAREAHILIIEPKSTLNTGNLKNDRTITPTWI